jgi:glycosyltransferase involved in cell wall biosynthesis
MRCPSLKELPSPPIGKTGWPWTEESPQIPEIMDDSSLWPKISIITPNFNGEQFIEETIRSVLLQGYPNLEYIIIDGGSNDNSIKIIKKYEKWLSYWISEPDRGQSHAINKGSLQASGDVMNWINSDDLLLKRALKEIGYAFNKLPNHILLGSGISFNENEGTEIETIPNVSLVQNIIKYWNGWFNCLQSSIFFSREAYFEVGKLDENLEFVMDNDLYCRLIQVYPLLHVNKFISKFRRHNTAKTCAQYNDMMLEHIKNSYKYRFILAESDIKLYKSKAILFIARRVKKLLLDNEFKQSFKYIIFSLKIDILLTILTSFVFLNKYMPFQKGFNRNE